MSETPDWVTEGATVAEYGTSGFRPFTTVTTIERLTATQIVCASGARYRRDTLKVVGDRYGAELLPLSDYRVVNARAWQRLASLRCKVDDACKDVPSNVESVRVALAEIEAIVAKTRAAIDAMPGA